MRIPFRNAISYLFLLLILAVGIDAFAEKKRVRKSYAGLFGSYEKERYADNEGQDFALGVDVMLSTLIPVSSYVKVSETRGEAGQNMYFATTFDVEAELFFNFFYNWQAFLNIGYYKYDSRRERGDRGAGGSQASQDQLQPKYSEFEFKSFPLILGLRYRFSRSEIVPYLGIGAGIAFVKRRGFYDFSNLEDEDSSSVLAGEILGGFEFFFAPGMGIRMEVAAYYMKLKERTFDSGQQANITPIISYQKNPWSIRYASGLFIIF